MHLSGKHRLHRRLQACSQFISDRLQVRARLFSGDTVVFFLVIPESASDLILLKHLVDVRQPPHRVLAVCPVDDAIFAAIERDVPFFRCLERRLEQPGKEFSADRPDVLVKDRVCNSVPIGLMSSLKIVYVQEGSTILVASRYSSTVLG